MLQRDEIRHTLIDLIENDIGQKFEDLSDGKNLREELGLDSVDVVSIVSQIERHFRIRLSQQELEQLVTVGNLLDLLQGKLSEPQPTPAPERRRCQRPHRGSGSGLRLRPAAPRRDMLSLRVPPGAKRKPDPVTRRRTAEVP